jgi:hypothetical protein
MDHAATKVRNAPTPSTVLSASHSGICYSAARRLLNLTSLALLCLAAAVTRERKDQAVAQNKLPVPGLDGCCHVETLIALSTPREKGER